MIKPTTIEELKLLVASKLDAHEFLDVLGWTLFDLVEEIDEDIFEEYFNELLRACD